MVTSRLCILIIDIIVKVKHKQNPTLSTGTKPNMIFNKVLYLHPNPLMHAPLLPNVWIQEFFNSVTVSIHFTEKCGIS